MRARVISGVIALGLLTQIMLAPPVSAQVGRAAKANQGPRALGLLVLQPNGKAHLIPITILIDGKYFDATAYKAAPVPMALWSETVYEALRTGVSQGLFTVTGALQQKDAKDANEWMGEGTWQSAESVKAKAVKKPESSEPRGLNQDEGPPVLRRSGPEKPKPAEVPAAPGTPPQAQPAPTASPSATPAATGQPQAPAAAPASSSPAVPLPPTNAHEDKPPEDKDRPVLKRGKPAPRQTEEPQKASATSTKAPGHAATAPPSQSSPAASGALSGGQAANQIQLIPAVSDSHGLDPVPYAYSMKPEEEQQFRKKMLAMAADEVRTRARQLASGSGGAAEPVRPSSQRSKATPVKPAQPIFEDVQLRVFDLADINEPELVLTANARMPQGPREKENAGPNLPYAVTLVVRQDVNGDLHKALVNVTDAQHLDVFPRLELIDAVDADGDGRGELLFRQLSDAGSAFVVYRVIGDRLYPLFQGTPGR